MSPRLLLQFLAALLTTLLVASTPAVADSSWQGDPSYEVSDGLGLAAPKQIADHSSRRARNTASLEEFFEIDDDAEQYFKPQPLLVRWLTGSTLVTRSAPAFHFCNAPPTHRSCAAYPTGPPHA